MEGDEKNLDENGVEQRKVKNEAKHDRDLRHLLRFTSQINRLEKIKLNQQLLPLKIQILRKYLDLDRH